MGFDSKVYERPINTLQAMMDNSKLGDVLTVYEDGDSQVYVNCKMPKRFLYEDNTVKCPNGLMLYDEENHKIETKVDGTKIDSPQKVYDYLDGCDIFDTYMNCTEEQRTQVVEWLKTEYNVKVAE